MIDMMEGVIEAVAAPKEIEYEDRQGNPATFTKYSFKMGNEMWYETTSPNEALRLVRGAYIKFSFEETQKGQYTNRRVKDFMSDMPETAPQTPQGSQRETELPRQAQSYGEPALRNGRAREISIAWGQSVNLAATSSIPSEEEPFDEWMSKVRLKARTLFPLLIKWEKEAVDNYFAQDKPVPLSDDQSREAELQNEARLRDPLPTQTQPALATDVDRLNWDAVGTSEGTPPDYEVPNWDYSQ